MTKQLEITGVEVCYGEVSAVRDANLCLGPADIAVILGPSGCGKTSLLRAVAGFEPVKRGEIMLNGRSISSPGHTLAPEQRRVGMVFQDFALFPHLRIADNIGFGLHLQTRGERTRRISELLELVDLEDQAAAYPHQLSGGQQQRVALARALAPAPEVLLLDEPFSSLDAELREHLAIEIRGLLKASNVPAIMVTHDQHEAFAMADQITLLQDGDVAQAGTPYELYHQPASPFVANCIGQGSLVRLQANREGQLDLGVGRLPAAALSYCEGEIVELLIRPDDVIHDPLSPVSLRVISAVFRGAQYVCELELPDGQSVYSLTPSHVEVGATMPVRFDLKHAVVFKKP